MSSGLPGLLTKVLELIFDSKAVYFFILFYFIYLFTYLFYFVLFIYLFIFGRDLFIFGREYFNRQTSYDSGILR